MHSIQKCFYINIQNIIRIIKNILIHKNTYRTIIAANTRIHDTQNINTRVKLSTL